jgi:hypothetical protein
MRKFGRSAHAVSVDVLFGIAIFNRTDRSGDASNARFMQICRRINPEIANNGRYANDTNRVIRERAA